MDHSQSELKNVKNTSKSPAPMEPLASKSAGHPVSIVKVQVPLSRFAMGSKLLASLYVQPSKMMEIQVPSAKVFALASNSK